MINYDYDATQYKENNYQLIPAGDHRVRVEEAKLLLRKGLNINKVALKLGFINSAALIRVFKRHEGITPGQYSAMK